MPETTAPPLHHGLGVVHFEEESHSCTMNIPKRKFTFNNSSMTTRRYGDTGVAG
jgi:hypothetical protein